MPDLLNRQTRLWAFSGLAALVALIGLLLLLGQIATALSEVRQQPRDNLQWSVYQLDRELDRFHRSLLEWRENDPAADKWLRDRFDILYSRISLLDGPLFSEALGPNETAERTQLRQFENEVDTILASPLTPATIAQMIDKVNAAQEFAHKFSLDILSFASKRSDEQRTNLERAVSLSIGGFIGLVLALLATIGLLFRQQGRLRQRGQALAETANTLQDAHRIAHLGTFLWDYRADRVTWSRELADIYGLAEEGSASGEQFAQLLHPEDRDEVEAAEAEAIKVAARTGRPSQRDASYRINRPDGTIAYVDAVAEIVVDDSGRPVRMTSTVRDVTTERERQQALENSQRRLEEAQRIAHLGSFSLDLTTGRSEWSDELYRITDFPGDPLSQARPKLEDIVHPDDLERLQGDMQRAASTPVPGGTSYLPLQHRLKWRNGEVRYVRGMAEYQFSDDGRPIRIAGTLQDVTNDVAQERALEAAKIDAERANAAKTEFLAVMSHELRTPMNGVIGTLSALDDSELDEDQRYLLRVARGSADSLLVLLNDILDLSKIEAGKLELEVTRFELRPLVRSVVHLYAEQSRSKGISLDSRIDPSVPLWFEGDAGRIRQILLNFASNAVKFTASGGVLINVRVVSAASDGATRLRFEVSDTGPGIPADVHAQVFAQFNQLDRSYARRFGGTGLGLAISRRLAELLGGSIGFDSVFGEGSTFWVEIPLTAVAAEARQPPMLVTPTVAMKILVAEDNSTNQLVARRLLQKLGHEVDVVSDGMLAVAAARAHSYDAILMDISMPGMDGIDATRHIRELPGSRGLVPIIALTANAMEADIKVCLDAGMNGFVGKPIDQAKLIETLGTILSHSDSTGGATKVAPQESDPVSPIDASLARLESEVGEEMMAEVLAAYQSDLTSSLARLATASERGDRKAFGEAAHSLRSVAITLGAPAVSELAQHAESACRSGEVFDLDESYRGIFDAAKVIGDDVSKALLRYK